MKTILEIIASIVILYLTMCLITLKWTPFINTYISSDIGDRILLLIMVGFGVALGYYIIQLIKTY
jgi:hypothetical protein